MERLIVDSNGAATIPPDILQRRGLSPGDELCVEETTQGWIVSPNGRRDFVPAWYEKWWNGLTDEERKQASDEARWYLTLSEEEKDALWSEADGDLAWVDEEDEDEEDSDWLEEGGVSEKSSS